MEDEQIDHRDAESVDSRIPFIRLIFTFVIHKPVFFDRILKTREKKKCSKFTIDSIGKQIRLPRFEIKIKIIEFFFVCDRVWSSQKFKIVNQSFFIVKIIHFRVVQFFMFRKIFNDRIRI